MYLHATIIMVLKRYTFAVFSFSICSFYMNVLTIEKGRNRKQIESTELFIYTSCEFFFYFQTRSLVHFKYRENEEKIVWSRRRQSRQFSLSLRQKKTLEAK